MAAIIEVHKRTLTGTEPVTIHIIDQPMHTLDALADACVAEMADRRDHNHGETQKRSEG